MSKFTKSELRKIYLEKREKLSLQEVETLSKNIFDRFIDYFDLSDFQASHLFLSIKEKKEVDTKLFIEYLWEKGISTFVPKMSGKELVSIELKPKTELIPNSWGILEPKGDPVENVSFDFVLTPLLYCDNQGNRVGYGKGFYDRFFMKAKTQIKIGLSFFPPNEEIADISETDIPLDYLVTPEGVFEFSSFKSKSIK